jgi:hypothetical protein
MKRALDSQEPYHAERGGKPRRKLPVAPPRAASTCNAVQLAYHNGLDYTREATTTDSTINLAVVDVATSLAQLRAGGKTNGICEQIKTAVAVDVDVLVLVQYGYASDASHALKSFYAEHLHQEIVHFWSESVGQRVNLWYNIHGNTVVVTAASTTLRSLIDVVDETKADVAQVCAYQFASGANLIVTAVSWRTNMPRADAQRRMLLIKSAILQRARSVFVDDVPCVICGRFNNKVMHTEALLSELGKEYKMVSEGPLNPLLHAIYQGCQALHGGEATFNKGVFHVLVTDQSFMARDQPSTSKEVSERNAEVAANKEVVAGTACKEGFVTLISRNAVQRASLQVTLTPKVHTHYVRFLENLTVHATENQQQLLEDVFQRYAGGNVAYFGRRGVCEIMPFTLPEKLDIMLKEVEKRRNLYIATLQSRNRCSRFSRTRNFTLSRNDLRQMMSAWEDDYESWMHPVHWQGFHK